MPAGGIASSGLGLLLGAGEAIWGGINKKKYQQQYDAESANRPKYGINPEEYNIQNLAESQAGQGMSDAARTQLQNQTESNSAAAYNAALKGGADPNTISSIAGNTQNSLNQNAIYEDQARLQHLSNLQNVWARMSANKDKQWTINEEQPWKDKMTSIYGQLQGANNMFNSGLNMAGSGLMSLGSKLFSSNSSGGQGGGDQGAGGAGESQMPSGGGNGQGNGNSGQDYGGSNLGMGGYSSPFMTGAMGGETPQYASGNQPVNLPANTQTNPFSNMYWQ